MNNQEINAALRSVNEVVFSNSLDESQKFYDDWSKYYDEHMEVLGSAYAPEAGEMFEKYGNDCKVMLDIGVGTGHVIEHIRNSGYSGIVDVLDGNMEMLLQAYKKNLKIRNIFRHLISENGLLPIQNEMYDIVTSAGTFIPNHAPATAVKGIMKVVKKGGLFIVTTRSKSTESYKVDFDRVVDELTQDGTIKVVETKEFIHFTKGNIDTCSMVYVLERLR